MKLKDYIKDRGFETIAAAATSAGFEHETFRKWVNGARRPRDPVHLQKISEWSDGNVTAVDFYTSEAA